MKDGMKRIVALILVALGLSFAACFDDGDEGPGTGCVGLCPEDVDKSDCSQVGQFQCGFEAWCSADGTVSASWHHHWIVDGDEQIVQYHCTYTCPNGCLDAEDAWPGNGAGLVAQICRADGAEPSPEVVEQNDVIDATDIAPELPVDDVPATDTDVVQSCDVPQFPYDCRGVTTFQCGVDAQCADGTIHVSWHHHYPCDGEEQIAEFVCNLACANGCTDGPLSLWPSNGTDLEAQGCIAVAE